MSEWAAARLGDHVEVLTGFPFKSGSYSADDSGVRLLRGDNVAQGYLRWGGVKRWPADLVDDDSQYELDEGDVVLAMDRPWIEAGLKFAAVQRSDIPALLVQRVARLRALEALDQRFLRYVIASPDFTKYVLAVQTGTAVPHISPGQIADYRFRRPPLPEQRAIGGVLGALDQKIEVNRRAAQGCEKLAQSLPAQFPPAVTVSSIADIRRQVVSPSSFADSCVEYFSLPAFDEGGLPVTEPGAAIKSGKVLLAGRAVLVSKLNPHIPRVWMAEPSGDRLALTSTEFVVLEPKTGCDVEVLWSVCSVPQFFGQLVEMVKGTTGSHQRVAPEDVLGVEVPDPLQFDRAMVDSIVSSVRLAGRIRRESYILASTRDELLPKLLSGELRIRDAETLAE